MRIQIAKLIAGKYIDGLEAKAEQSQKAVDQRVAEVLSKMDPFEPLMRKFNGVFSEEYEHPDDPLDERGKLSMMIWGWQQRNNPSFKYMVEWIQNVQANQIFKKPITKNTAFELVIYAKAQISNMVLLVKEVGRLASLYDEKIKKPGEDFDSSTGVE